jgi:hypothetical protein
MTPRYDLVNDFTVICHDDKGATILTTQEAMSAIVSDDSVGPCFKLIKKEKTKTWRSYDMYTYIIKFMPFVNVHEALSAMQHIADRVWCAPEVLHFVKNAVCSENAPEGFVYCFDKDGKVKAVRSLYTAEEWSQRVEELKRECERYKAINERLQDNLDGYVKEIAHLERRNREMSADFAHYMREHPDED